MSRKALFVPSFLSPVIACAHAAGDIIMSYYGQGGAVEQKADDSPVTAADKDADRLIVNTLQTLIPAFPVISEEGAKPDVSHAEYFWLVDPIDGTKSFVRGHGFFTVNIALIEHATYTPVLGVIYDPVHRTMYWGTDAGAFRQDGPQDAVRIYAAPPADKEKTAFISHSRSNEQTLAYLREHGITERIACASSIKFCFLAEGKASMYPRFGPSMEWDVAAGHAILHAAGGTLKNSDGSHFRYGKKDFLNGDFIACGNTEHKR